MPLCATPPAAKDSARLAITDLDIPTTDGIKIKATYYSPGKAGPGIILFHQCNDNLGRKSWDALATLLAKHGIHVITYDYRGHGGTPAGGNNGENPPADADAVLGTLLVQPGVDSNNIGVGGASCGAAYAFLCAMRNGHVKAVMLLSGQLSENGLAYLSQHSEMAIFEAASLEEDAGGAVTHKTVAASKNPASTAMLVPTRGHGVTMFAAAPSLIPAIVAWYGRLFNN